MHSHSQLQTVSPSYGCSQIRPCNFAWALNLILGTAAHFPPAAGREPHVYTSAAVTRKPRREAPKRGTKVQDSKLIFRFSSPTLLLPILPQLKKTEPGARYRRRKEHQEENYKGFSSSVSDCLPPFQLTLPSSSFSVAILGFLHKLNPVFQIGQWKVFAMLKSFPELNRETWGSRAILQLAGMWLAIKGSVNKVHWS